ncbi:hypothetical protein VOLCADRAFT_107380 [Volvox carteri f. nagariensis]|uniref:Uncharacterized protein n=1 Tax=Volvox carteri f. nagariensis TaxID=3068 RepID=D8UDM7_VOLCA|nr:uncharacterized protein VOLCADRAFT_107380 [Volvox carteri f. nagariensis]EFJ42222.1 hypothetical protein VOLCADRAFT_107380 [Volvox carteri f. nagariensis]|eukprot:XP_002956765.1 hypothetical protein VOLCADRAFT_107380 [Volvox carteri f. nagariensis]
MKGRLLSLSTDKLDAVLASVGKKGYACPFVVGDCFFDSVAYVLEHVYGRRITGAEIRKQASAHMQRAIGSYTQELTALQEQAIKAMFTKPMHILISRKTQDAARYVAFTISMLGEDGAARHLPMVVWHADGAFSCLPQMLEWAADHKQPILCFGARKAEFNNASRVQSTSKMHILLNGDVDKDDELLEACMLEDNNVPATTRNNLADSTYTGSVIIIQDLIDRIQGLDDILFYRCTNNTCGGTILNNTCNLCNKHPDAQIPVLQPLTACLVLGNNSKLHQLWGKLRHGNNGNPDLYRALHDFSGLERVLGRMRQPVQGAFVVNNGDILRYGVTTASLADSMLGTNQESGPTTSKLATHTPVAAATSVVTAIATTATTQITGRRRHIATTGGKDGPSKQLSGA